MSEKSRFCPQCGAALIPGEASCPYCGSSLYGPEAERDYMRKLEAIRSDLDRVGEAGAEASEKEVGRIGRKILATCIVVFALAAVATGLVVYSNRRQNEKSRREYAWSREAFPEMDALFEAGDYEALLEAYRGAMDEGHDLYLWKHCGFCEYYEAIGFADAALYYREKGVFGKDDAILLLHDELKFRGLSLRADIPKEDKKILASRLERFSDDLTEIFCATREEIDEFDRSLKKSGGYPYYDTCSAFVEKHPEILRDTQGE